MKLVSSNYNRLKSVNFMMNLVKREEIYILTREENGLSKVRGGL